MQLLLWRALLGIGMGGEWASGAVLVSETWPAAHRGKAISIMQSGWALGYILAALLAALVLGLPPRAEGWRWLFVAGRAAGAASCSGSAATSRSPRRWTARPADDRRPVPTRSPCSSGRTARGATCASSLLDAAVQFAYWGLFFWLPTFLRGRSSRRRRHERRKSLGWIIPMQLGAYLGYLSFGFIADRSAAGRLHPLPARGGRAGADLRPDGAQPLVLLVLGRCSASSARLFQPVRRLLAELFRAVRATGQGMTYNSGRGGRRGARSPSACSPEPGIGIGLALSLTSAFFLLAAALVFTLPDRSGQALDALSVVMPPPPKEQR